MSKKEYYWIGPGGVIHQGRDLDTSKPLPSDLPESFIKDGIKKGYIETRDYSIRKGNDQEVSDLKEENESLKSEVTKLIEENESLKLKLSELEELIEDDEPEQPSEEIESAIGKKGGKK